MKIFEHVLAPLSWMFGCIVVLRNMLYERGLLKIHHYSVPVISVGNIVAGGTGKTPLVEYLVRYFGGKRLRVAVLSRGYRRSSRGFVVVSDGAGIRADAASAGDEPFQIASKFPGAVVAVDERRARAAEKVIARFTPDVIVLDDGFQHRSLHRDLDIVMVGGRRPVFEEPLIPAGRRREPFSSVRRAHLLAVSGDEASARRLVRYTDAPVINVRLEPVKLRRLDSGDCPAVGDLRGRECIAFCGIGTPDAFHLTLEGLGLRIRKFSVYPDHYRYHRSDLDDLLRAVDDAGCSLLLTTEKDAVRIRSLSGGTTSAAGVLHYLEVETRVVGDEAVLHSALDRALEGMRS